MTTDIYITIKLVYEKHYHQRTDVYLYDCLVTDFSFRLIEINNLSYTVIIHFLHLFQSIDAGINSLASIPTQVLACQSLKASRSSFGYE